jgi:hypothetical protein
VHVQHGHPVFLCASCPHGRLGRCLIPTAVGPWLSSRVRLSLRSARGERLVGLYGGDDVADCLADRRGISLVDQRGVGGVGDYPVAAVGPQGGQLVLGCPPGVVVAAADADCREALNDDFSVGAVGRPVTRG